MCPFAICKEQKSETSLFTNNSSVSSNTSKGNGRPSSHDTVLSICRNVVFFLISGSPFTPKITDRSKVHLLDDLTDLKDENDRLALECDKETVLSYNVGEAGPGIIILLTGDQ